jgi:hypothetical protein
MTERKPALRNPLLCDDCGHHIHRPDPCRWTFGAGRNKRACECSSLADEDDQWRAEAAFSGKYGVGP